VEGLCSTHTDSTLYISASEWSLKLGHLVDHLVFTVLTLRGKTGMTLVCKEHMSHNALQELATPITSSFLVCSTQEGNLLRNQFDTLCIMKRILNSLRGYMWSSFLFSHITYVKIEHHVSDHSCQVKANVHFY
jgi:hypothetical protein